MGKVKDWFSGLSKGGKVGVVAGGLMLVGATNSLATPGVVPTPTSSEVKQPQIEVKEESESEVIPFTSSTIEDANLPKGETKITTVGVNGVRTLTYKVTYTDGIETSRTMAVNKVTTEPIAEVKAVGTYVAPAPAARVSSSCDTNYSGCVPLVSYDLDCPDIGFRVQVLGSDPHGFDGNGDGVGCEAY